MNTQQTAQLLVALGIILVLSQLFGALARRLHQPAVVGEIVLGILAGPTLLHGGITDAFFPLHIRPLLSALAMVGVAFFMFIVGLEVDHQLLRGLRAKTGVIVLGSTTVPFTLGVGAALWLARDHVPRDRLGYVLFMGTAMSITAFPVLARILDDRRITRTPLGSLALSSAAVGDLIAWTMLAVVVAIAGTGGNPLWRISLVVPFVLGVFFLGRPALNRVLSASSVHGPDDPAGSGRMLTVVVASLLGAGAFMEWSGLHYIFGTFLVGVILPRGENNWIRIQICDRLEQISRQLLMPVFFVLAGINVNLSTLGLSGVGALGLILLVAIGGKLAGTMAAARLAGVRTRQSANLAVLMNTRGLTELVVLATGVQLGILDHRTYSMMVVMALLTTAMTGPLLDLLYRPEPGYPVSQTAEPVVEQDPGLPAGLHTVSSTR
jgi:Kef-type K+ transport system membrane component KefB